MSSDLTSNVLIGLVIGGLMVLALVAIVGGFLVAHRGRLLMHAERMKALEAGRELPDDAETARIKAASQARQARQAGRVEHGSRAMAGQCYSTTVAACGSGFVFAWLAASNQAVALAIASATGAVGVTGLICGTVLASRPGDPREGVARLDKPRFDPEAI